ncbi:FAD-dependent oxidoreductase [Nonomuraea sp. NPDC050556]|uniref:FAD-dependent oxidoreductase n=1 Tax=Nonomuraea sp. NPDC050556 TaxID=3364369 RepID=UPI0037A8432F
MRISIIGGGIGGLCLAQGLRAKGIDATVYETSPRPLDQGWRLTLKEEGTRALRACLPGDLYARVLDSAIRPATRMAFMDHRLVPKFVKPIPPVEGHIGINRTVLRSILATGLNLQIRTCASFDGPTAHFTDGTSATADLLVGADGTDSVVRRQLLPTAALDDLGSAVYGVTPFETLDGVPDLLVDTFNRITGPDGSAVSIATCRPGDYFTWTLTGTLTDDWHPAVRKIIADATTTFPIRLRSARPVSSWDVAGVTLLGDAIHTMSPGRGEGANTALRDARLLVEAVLSGDVRGYEEEMLRYGFAMVAASRESPFMRT